MTSAVADPSFDIAIVFGSTYGRTEEAALRIADEIESRLGVRPAVFDVGASGAGVVREHSVVLIGVSTWNVGELQADWELALPDLLELDLRGKLVGLFGAGDAFGYPDTFQDALGIVGEACEERGAELIAAWPAAGYDFDASRALRGGQFVGLALDYDNQEHLNEARIVAWCGLVTDTLLARGSVGAQLVGAAVGG